MRKIQTREELEKARKRNSKIFVYVILGILIFSSLGYAFFSNPNGTSTNQEIDNTGVQNLGGQWAFRYGDQIHYVASSPDSVKDTTISLDFGLENYAGQEIYVDSSNQGIYNEISSNLERYVSKIQRACYQNCEEDLPEKTCEDNLIVWKESEGNRVYEEGKCVFIEGDIRAVDAFIYKLFNIK